MIKLSKKRAELFCTLLLALSVLSMPILFSVSLSRAAELMGISPGDKPSSLRLQLSQKIPVKVILVDDKEVLIALKDAAPSSSMKPGSGDGVIFKSVELESLPGNVLAIIVTGMVPFKAASSQWDDNGLNLTVNFTPLPGRDGPDKTGGDIGRAGTDTGRAGKESHAQAGSAPSGSDKPADDTSTLSRGDAPSAKSSMPSVHFTPLPPFPGAGSIADMIKRDSYGSSKNRIPGRAGDISDMVFEADLDGCNDRDLKKASILLKQFQWQNAHDLLDGYMAGGAKDCLEKAELLRAFAYYQSIYQSIEGDDLNSLIHAESLFQSFIVNWPDSLYRPYSHTALGLIFDDLGNSAASEGHFTIVMDDYPDYAGIPEVMYHLGKIHHRKEYMEKAMEYYSEVFEKHPESVYAVAAGVGLGKALFKKLHYIDSRDLLTALVGTNPEIMFESPEVLMSIGDAEFALGRNEHARENLNKAYNIFFDLPDKHMVMTRVGDTYANEKKMERAKKVYEFVMDKFPGTEGFLGSAMGLALCLSDRTRVEELYEMVKTDFADHALSRVAMMRLAELYYREGEYQRSIEEIETLLATHPTGLRYDAVKLMQQAYESLFDENLRTGNYTYVLRTYEGARILLDRLESPLIHLLTGLSYLDAHLYEQAFQQLSRAYNGYEPPDQTLELILSLAIAMDETDRDDDALGIFQSYLDRAPDGSDKVNAMVRMGDIFFKKEDGESALDYYADAFVISRDRIEKGNILNREADVHASRGSWGDVVTLLERALKEYASAPGENYDFMSNTYRALGKAHVETSSFVKAAESFTMALKLSDNAGYDGSDIAFMLGDAYQKANALEKAKETFERVADTEDSIWARLARERLSTLTLAETLSNS
ncbi:MAG: tetratricopeptide repeat protein [Desulfamplus sp.]|nr:tetratricopeptide repeat protein [Desulfamplus sp.]